MVFLYLTQCLLGSKNEDNTAHWDVISFDLVDLYHWFGGTSDIFTK
jgi:hypothetical protein